MLGKVQYDNAKEQDEFDLLGQSRYRHQFLQPKSFNSQDDKTRRLINLHKRLVLLIESFRLDNITNTSLDLKATPTRNEDLSHSAIPHYFIPNVTSNVPGISQTNLAREWNYNLSVTSRNMLEGRDIPVFNYHENLISSDNFSDPSNGLVAAPLYYQHPIKSYKLEGLVGKEIDLVLTAEKQLIDHFQLPFATLKLDLLNIDPSDPTTYRHIVVESRYWAELQSDYQMILNDLIALIKNLNAELKVFYRETENWVYDDLGINLMNVKNRIDEVRTNIRVFTDDAGAAGISEDLIALVRLFPTLIEDLYQNGEVPILFDRIKNDYRSSRRDLAQSLLLLEHAMSVLTKEKIDVLPDEMYHEWVGTIQQVSKAISQFLQNTSFYQLFTLYHRFVHRYDFLQRNHYSAFCNFISRHPGLCERVIEKGNTHVILTHSLGSPVDPVVDLDELQLDTIGGGSTTIIGDFVLPYYLDPKDITIPIDPEVNELPIPPLARGEAALVARGGAIIIDATENDLNPQRDSIRIARKGFTNAEGVFTSGKSKEDATIVFHQSQNAVIRYEPQNNFVGIDCFEYALESSNDRDRFEDTAFVEVLVVDDYVKHVNAIGNLAATDSFHSVDINVLNNDTYQDEVFVAIENDSLTGLSQFGATVEVVGEGNSTIIRYTPIYGREGKDSFSYTISQNRNIDGATVTETSTATVEVVVICCDRFEFELVCEGNEADFHVASERESQNEYDLFLIDSNGNQVEEIFTEHGKLTVTNGINPIGDDDDDGLGLISGASRAQIDTSLLGLSLVAVGGLFIKYVPDLYFTGEEEFVYEVIDNQGFVRRAKVQILVIASDENRLERTLRNTPRKFNVRKAGERTLRVFSERENLVTSIPTDHGIAAITEDDGGFEFIRYTPNPGYCGLDRFDYAVTSSEGVIKYRQLTVIVDGYEKTRVASTVLDSPVILELLDEDLLENGYGFRLLQEDGSTTSSSISSKEGGIVDPVAVIGHAVTYSPASQFLGEDSFRYAITLNSEIIEYGRYHIIVDVMKRLKVEYTLRDTPFELTLIDDSITGGDAELVEISHIGIRGASVDIIDASLGTVRYTPAPDYIGQDSFDYLIQQEETKVFGTVHVIVDSQGTCRCGHGFPKRTTRSITFSIPGY